MKTALLFFTVGSLFVCFCQSKEKKDGPMNENSQEKSTGRWIESFKEFRDAMSQGDRKKVKQFFDFPVIGDDNSIWYLLYRGDKNAEALPNSVKPLTEKDFDTYFDKLFSPLFVNRLLLIKPEELDKTGRFETDKLKKDSVTYTMSANYSKEYSMLMIGLYAATRIKVDDGEVDGGINSEVYVFRILKNGSIKFLKFMSAE